MLPHLTNILRIKRDQFTLSQLHDLFDNSLDRHFKSQLNTVHLDEKLFYTTDELKQTTNIHLRIIQRRRGRARGTKSIVCSLLLLLDQGMIITLKKTWWDGKIGMHPTIVELVPAIRNSKKQTSRYS